MIAVTTLADSGPGSLREACETKGARIVMFRASGLIDLQTPVSVTEPYITIAGQTAPGTGICLKLTRPLVHSQNESSMSRGLELEYDGDAVAGK